MRIVIAETRQADELAAPRRPASASSRGTPRVSRPKRTLSPRSSRETGRSPGTPWRSPPASRQPRYRCDRCRRVRPARMRSSVDLPQPDGPTMQTNSPGATRDRCVDRDHAALPARIFPPQARDLDRRAAPFRHHDPAFLALTHQGASAYSDWRSTRKLQARGGFIGREGRGSGTQSRMSLRSSGLQAFRGSGDGAGGPSPPSASTPPAAD